MREYTVKVDGKLPQGTMRRLIRQAMLQTIREVGKDIYDNSQELCPVFPSPYGIFKNPRDRRLSKISYQWRGSRPGYLKRHSFFNDGRITSLSGGQFEEGEGIQIRYAAPYASFEERGFIGGVQHVSGYYRGGQATQQVPGYVKGQDRYVAKYKRIMPTYVPGYTRLMPTREPVEFIRRPWELQQKQFKDRFADNFNRALALLRANQSFERSGYMF